MKGESPDLLPLLDEAEESAVLTLHRWLEVQLLNAAIKATLETPRYLLDSVTSAPGSLRYRGDGTATLRLPDDYLALHSLYIEGWREPLTDTEPEGTLRDELRGNAPRWMRCEHNPMAVEGRDEDGRFLTVYGVREDAEAHTLLYVPLPTLIDGTLTIAAAAYPRLLQIVTTD